MKDNPRASIAFPMRNDTYNQSAVREVRDLIRGTVNNPTVVEKHKTFRDLCVFISDLKHLAFKIFAQCVIKTILRRFIYLSQTICYKFRLEMK